MTEIFYPDECYQIQGACFEVSKQMGCGFLEAVYQECLEKEFQLRKISFESQKTLRLHYKGTELIKTYEPDFVCYGKIIVEIKAVSSLCRRTSSTSLELFESHWIQAWPSCQFWCLSQSDH